jgi:histidinol-phosphate aminotransferase
MSIAALARPDIVAMKPYSSARAEAPGRGVLLNANESPRPLFGRTLDALNLNRYPDPQPEALVEGMADRYGLPVDHVLLTRGSDEGIDLLTRVFCRAGKDAVLHCPPTFGMYRVAAQAQGAAVVAVPRAVDDGFALDTEGVLAALNADARIRLVFLTSPNNPTGDVVEAAFLERLLAVAEGRAIVVVDEAYAEFCPHASFTAWITRQSQLVVLRTLSKAWAAAGLRCGAVLAQPEVVGLLRRIIAPYPLSSPVVSLALRSLEPDMARRQQKLLREIGRNKVRLAAMLEGRRFIRRLWIGEANFVLARVDDATGLLRFCTERGVILRGFPAEPALGDCIRITVGSQKDLDALETALDEWESNTP